MKNGKPRPYKGDAPLAAGMPALAGLGIGLALLDRMARGLPLDAPWDARAPHAGTT